jgi:hypothetical protein
LLPEGAAPPGAVLTGDVRGPACRFAQTLQASVGFLQHASGPGLLAEALLPDPCYWSPELPFTYQARLALAAPGRPTETHERLIGIRPLGARGTRLYYQGRGWTPRLVRLPGISASELPAWRGETLLLRVPSPADDVCREATLLGVMLVAELPNDAFLPDELARLARWPAVAIALVPPGTDLSKAVRTNARNLLLAASVGPGEALKVPEGAHLLLVDWDGRDETLANLPTMRPTLVARTAARAASPAAARAACDQLQRDLAGRAEAAGFCV